MQHTKCGPSCHPLHPTSHVLACSPHALAAGDIGAVAVFASVFYLPPPRALNYLINECFKGPTLVLQV